MVSLSNNDKRILAEYDPTPASSTSTLLSVKSGQLAILNRSDITCFNIFLSFFGMGKLAHTAYHLTSVTDYLGSKDLKAYKEGELNDQDARIQKALLALTDKILLHRKQTEIPLILKQMAITKFALATLVTPDTEENWAAEFVQVPIYLPPKATVQDLYVQSTFYLRIKEARFRASLPGKPPRVLTALERVDDFNAASLQKITMNLTPTKGR